MLEEFKRGFGFILGAAVALYIASLPILIIAMLVADKYFPM